MESHVVDSGWTDEKHTSFLNSIESSFVDQLYGSQYPSKEVVGWLSRWKNRSNPSGLAKNDPSIDQFKVQCQGCWNNVRCGRLHTGVAAKNDRVFIAKNRWIQRFISSPNGKEVQHASADMLGADEIVKSSTQAENHGIEASDQNFVDGELDEKEQPTRTSKKKRLTSIASPTVLLVNNQLVPNEHEKMVTPISPEIHACLDEGNSEGVGKTWEITSSFVYSDEHTVAESAVFKDHGKKIKDSLPNFSS